MALGGLLEKLIIPRLERLLMRLNVVQEVRLQGPPEKVEFPNGCNKGGVALYAKLDALSTTIRVEILLVISVKLTLVRFVDNKTLPVKFVKGKVLAAVLGHEPVDDAKANICVTRQVRHDLGYIGIRGIKALKGGDNQLGLTVDFLATSLRVRRVGGGVHVYSVRGGRNLSSQSTIGFYGTERNDVSVTGCQRRAHYPYEWWGQEKTVASSSAS